LDAYIRARVTLARGPPLWEPTGVEHDPSTDPLLQSDPALEFDQRIALVATIAAARLCLPRDRLVPAAARLRAAAQASPPAGK